VLQARTSSSRLPAKSLLPIGGLPLAVLCARRLGSAGHQVVLATSEDASDDLLALTAQRAGLEVFRGSLNNVLQRFVRCTADLGDEDIVVRATGDNPLPDGRFVGALIERFAAAGGDYFATTSPEDGLPYGLSAEVFRAGALRGVASGTPDALDFENVTTTLRRRAGARGIVARRAFFEEDLSRLRVTIDTLEDYLAMAALFAEVGDPVTEDWSALVRRLASRRTPAAAAPGVPAPAAGRSSLALGTIQLGQKYGIANTSGQPGEAEAAEMLTLALRSGITHLDTARAYGDAEARIGRLLPARAASTVKVVTKLLPLDGIPDDAPAREVRTAVDASVFRSCHDLRRERLDVLMFHRSADMFRWRGAALERLAELAGEGVVGALGASVYTPEEATACLADARIAYLQLPFNLLDGRWLNGSFASALSGRKDVQVHVRSVFLQGLLLSDAALWPKWVLERCELVAEIERLSRKFGRKSRADLCIAYVRSFPWVATLVLGAETLRQLEQLVPLASEPALTEQQAREIQAVFAGVPERLLNPARWDA
jgi:spore coat polysaccharide biosynthesis protein SpsF